MVKEGEDTFLIWDSAGEKSLVLDVALQVETRSVGIGSDREQQDW